MNFDFITERVAVGQKIDSQEFADALAAAGITLVINLFAGNKEIFWRDSTDYFPQEDDGSARNPYQVRMICSAALLELSRGGKVYIHCQWGLGRAPSACYAVLRQLGFSQEQAASLICLQRPQCATWNWQQYIPSIEQALSQ